MMKRIVFLAVATLLVAACAFSLPGKFTQLADKVAAKGADYTPKQWEKSNAQFEKLVQQYIDKYDKLSNGLKQIDELLKQVPAAIDTATEGVKGFLEELGL